MREVLDSRVVMRQSLMPAAGIPAVEPLVEATSPLFAEIRRGMAVALALGAGALTLAVVALVIAVLR